MSLHTGYYQIIRIFSIVFLGIYSICVGKKRFEKKEEKS